MPSGEQTAMLSGEIMDMNVEPSFCLDRYNSEWERRTGEYGERKTRNWED